MGNIISTPNPATISQSPNITPSTESRSPLAVISSPSDADSIKNSALKQLIKGNFNEAAEKYSEYLEKYPNAPDRDDILMNRADAYIGAQRYKEAEKDLKEVIESGKKGATPYLCLGMRVYVEMEEDQKAYECLKKAFELREDIEKDPFFIRFQDGKPIISKSAIANFYMVAGILSHDLGHYEDSLKYLARAMDFGDIDPALHLAILERAMANFKLERYEEAKKFAKQWLNKKVYKKPDHYRHFQELADANMIVGNYDEALNYINKAIQMKPDDFGFYINKGRIYLMMKDYKSAGECFAITRKHLSKGKWDIIELERLEKLMKKAMP